jgi:hypothetical protein
VDCTEGCRQGQTFHVTHTLQWWTLSRRSACWLNSSSCMRSLAVMLPTVETTLRSRDSTAAAAAPGAAGRPKLAAVEQVGVDWEPAA